MKTLLLWQYWAPQRCLACAVVRCHFGSPLCRGVWSGNYAVDRGMNSLPFCLLVHSNWRRKQVLKDSNCLSLYGNEEGLSALLHNLTRTRDCARHRKGLVQVWLILEFLALTLSFISVIFIYLYMLLLAAQAMWVMAECLDFSPLMWLVMCPLQANILSAGLSSGYPFTPLLHPDYL